jgi:hypothetical protein
MGETPVEFYYNSAVAFLHFQLKRNRRCNTEQNPLGFLVFAGKTKFD